VREGGRDEFRFISHRGDSRGVRKIERGNRGGREGGMGEKSVSHIY